MSSVVSRTFASVPQRDSIATWTAIVDLLTKGKTGAARNELLAVSGIAASLIADQTPRDAAIVVICDGPRTRIYCVYDETAIENDADESSLGFDPLKGDWAISIPCAADELGWVKEALKAHSSRITVRDMAETISIDEGVSKGQAPLVLDVKGFLSQ
jgi:hypothetical protein